MIKSDQLMVGVVFIGLASLVALICLQPTTNQQLTKTVWQVGGCAVNGRCGVMFTDGSCGYVRLPAPGMKTKQYEECEND